MDTIQKPSALGSYLSRLLCESVRLAGGETKKGNVLKITIVDDGARGHTKRKKKKKQKKRLPARSRSMPLSPLQDPTSSNNPNHKVRVISSPMVFTSLEDAQRRWQSRAANERSPRDLFLPLRTRDDASEGKNNQYLQVDDRNFVVPANHIEAPFLPHLAASESPTSVIETFGRRMSISSHLDVNVEISPRKRDKKGQEQKRLMTRGFTNRSIPASLQKLPYSS